MTDKMSSTMKFSIEQEKEEKAKDIIIQVYEALEKKGYNPVNQFVGYILSGDPSYITSHEGARSLIRKIERDEMLEEMVRDYIKNNQQK